MEGDLEVLGKEAAASVGVKPGTKENASKTNATTTKKPTSTKTPTSRAMAADFFESNKESRTSNFKIPKFLNSDKFPKDKRPPELEDDELVNAMDTNVVAQMVMKHQELKIMREANEIKTKKAESKSTMKKNTEVKIVKIEAGEDDSTTVLHPKRFLRPPVLAPSRYWHLFPVEYKEIYYSIHLEHVGLENVLSQKTVALLHDRRNEFKVQFFSQINANVGLDKIANNITFQKDGSADIKSHENWAEVVTLNELTMALDNIVAAWSVFWPGDQSMVTIRRVVSRKKEFNEIRDAKTRKKLLEAYINKMFQINSRRAAQGDVPLTYKEALEQSKEYLDTPYEYVSHYNIDDEKQKNNANNANKRSNANNGNNTNNKRISKASEYWEQVKKLKIDGKEICIEFNKMEGCKEGNRCRKAHKCAYMERGEMKQVCGGRHSKTKHHDWKDK